MTRQDNIHPLLLKLMQEAIEKGASDLHLKVGIVPVIRVVGTLKPLSSKQPELSEKQIETIIDVLLDDEQKQIYKDKKELDIGLGVSGLGRFRINIFRQRGTARMVIRNIPHTVPQINELNLPPIIEKIANIERGLILVTGVTGSGKSSTLAAIVDYINRTKNKHVLTIEDPIEYLIRDRKSIITQRELGLDTTNYAHALRAALRQDPDVILIGEMRDKETIETAITAAQTGHLVLSTLHTLDSRETVNRILGAFEPHQQMQIRLQLASVLKAVISQRLAKRKDNRGFVPAVEILIANTRIKEMIENPQRTSDISEAIRESRSSFGMQTFDQSLVDLVKQKLITIEHALELTNHPEDFKIQLSGINDLDGGKKWKKQETQTGLNPYWQNIEDVEMDMDITHVEDSKKRKKKRSS